MITERTLDEMELEAEKRASALATEFARFMMGKRMNAKITARPQPNAQPPPNENGLNVEV